jgi:5-methyltetrahydropteroyltriglutamate--homocysteine methyltransferase
MQAERRASLPVREQTAGMKPEIRVDQIGSYVRPDKLLDARDLFAERKITREQLRQVEDEAILDCLQMQKNAGMRIFGDGEFRRDSWMTPLSEAVEGFVDHYQVEYVDRPDGGKEKIVWHQKPVKGKLRQERRLTQVDAAFLKNHAPGPFKITLPSPLCMRRSFKEGLTDTAYTNDRALIKDAADITKGEVSKLCDEGVSYIQLDEGFLAYVREEFRDGLKKKGLDPDRELQKDIDSENEVYQVANDKGVTTALHICRGSRVTFHKGIGAYDWLAERLFTGLHVSRYLLEYDDTGRVGGYEPLRHLPKGKVVVLGLVSSKDAPLEQPENLMREVEKASKFCSVDQLALSSQCGFHAAADRNGAHITADQQRRKLELMVNVAEKIWGH